jgi:Lar family restriction alleviation protein
MNDPKELYNVYANWTGRLHHWLGQRGRHIDCEYFPDTYEFRIYSGHAEIDISQSGLVGLVRPHSERFLTLALPKPQDDPTQRDLDDAFRQICFAAARLLEVDLGKPQLTEDNIMPPVDIGDHEVCPFCGQEDSARLTHRSDEGLYIILCSNCGASGPTGESVEEAWDGWDSREV